MTDTKNHQPEQVRDGMETNPESADVASLFPLPSKTRSLPDELLDEALIETFPASDPIASGRID